MKTKKNALIGRVTSSILALTLVAGLVPSAGIAFATEANEDQANNQTEQTDTAPQSDSGTQPENAESSVQASDAQASDVNASQVSGDQTGSANTTPEITNETVKLEGSSSANASASDASTEPAQGASANDVQTGNVSKTPTYNSSSANITSVQVPLTPEGEKPQAVGSVEYGGIKYTINTEDTKTVSVTGVSSVKPTGDIQIQSQVAIDGTLYPVVSIKVPAVENIQNTNEEAYTALTNPYTNDFFNLEDVAEEVSSVTIPTSITDIDLAFFQMFPNLKNIEVTKGNDSYTSFNGILFDSELAHLLLVPEGMEGTAVLPDTMATVPACVFSQCIKLQAISVADKSAGSTGSSAFISSDGILYKKNLDGAGVPDGTLTLIAAPAQGASAVIAEECASIDEGAFISSRDLKTIIVKGNVEAITTSSETYISTITTNKEASISLPEVIPTFNENTISAATVVLGPDVDSTIWEDVGFTNFESLAPEEDESGDVEGEEPSVDEQDPTAGTEDPAEEPENTIAVDAQGFGYTLLEDFTLAISWAKEDMAPSTSLTLPSVGTYKGREYTVSAIADEGFANQSTIVYIELPESIKEVGASAFANCTSLKTIHLANTVETIGTSAFENTALTTFAVPQSLTSINENAFAATDSLTIVDAYGIAFIHPTALAAATNAKVYVPYLEDETYNWSVGLPINNNKLMPYGLKLGPAIEMKVGETANMFDEGGYLMSPGSVYAKVKYPAKAFSIDATTGDVTALDEGSIQFKIWLQMELDEIGADGEITTREIMLTEP